jgi:hypothetical protein
VDAPSSVRHDLKPPGVDLLTTLDADAGQVAETRVRTRLVDGCDAERFFALMSLISNISHHTNLVMTL